jgi:hypothetical protein
MIILILITGIEFCTHKQQVEVVLLTLMFMKNWKDANHQIQIELPESNWLPPKLMNLS